MTSAYASAVEESNGLKDGVETVRDLLQQDLHDAEDAWARNEVYTEAAEALCALGNEYNGTADIIEYIENSASNWAQNWGTGQGTDDFTTALCPPLREQLAEETEEALDNADSDTNGDTGSDGVMFTADHGVALDEYVERNLVRVVRRQNQDTVADPSYVFDFDEAAVEFDAPDEYQSYTDFYEAIAHASDKQVLSTIASEEAEEAVVGDPYTDDYAEQQYRIKSNGPPERPWGLNWNEVITHLTTVEAEGVIDVEGVNTAALRLVERAIGHARAAHDKQSVVDAGDGAIHYDEDNDEYWVPSEIVTSACEEAGTSPESLAYELDTTGVVSDDINGASYSDGTVHPTTRFWRFKTGRVETSPENVVPVIETSSHAFARPDDDAAGAGSTVYTDGGDGDDE